MPEGQRLCGPRGYPIVGHLFSIIPGALHKQVTEWSKTHGNVFVIYVLGKRLVFISSSKTIRDAFDSPCNTCLNFRSTTFFGNYVLDKSIAMSTDTNCAAKLRPILCDFVTKSFDNENEGTMFLAKTFGSFETLAVPGKDVEAGILLRKALQDFMSQLLTGVVIPEGDPDKDILWDFVDNLFVMIDPSVDGPLKMFPWLRHLPGYYGDVYRKTIAARDKVGKRMFDDQKASYVPGRIRGLVDVCIRAQQEELTKTGSSWLSDEYIKGLVFDTLAAGMTELMKSLRLIILLMCHHPDIQTQLQAEIDAVIGSERFPAGSDRQLVPYSQTVMLFIYCDTYSTERFPMGSDRQWMPYSQAVMLEVWRYGSQTPLAIPHLCSQDVVVDDYLIEKGSLVFPNLYGVHHDEAIWGDPWVFRPDRFLDQARNLLPQDHVIMQNVIPFSLGKRACPGQDFARSRIFIAMTSLLQRVRIVPPETSALPSADPRLYTKNYPLSEPSFSCRFTSQENIIL